MTAMEREKEQRQDPAVRAERTLARWTALEKAYEDGDWKERTRAKREMKTLARELKRDPAAEAVLKSRAKELGIEAGSRLKAYWKRRMSARRCGWSAVLSWVDKGG